MCLVEVVHHVVPRARCLGSTLSNMTMKLIAASNHKSPQLVGYANRMGDDEILCTTTLIRRSWHAARRPINRYLSVPIVSHRLPSPVVHKWRSVKMTLFSLLYWIPFWNVPQGSTGIPKATEMFTHFRNKWSWNISRLFWSVRFSWNRQRLFSPHKCNETTNSRIIAKF